MFYYSCLTREIKKQVSYCIIFALIVKQYQSVKSELGDASAQYFGFHLFDVKISPNVPARK